MDVIPTTDALDQPTVMTQIRKLVEITDENISEFADTINEGTYKSVSMTGPVNGKYTFNFVNQNDETESFDFLVKDIKTVASSQSGSTVTLTVTYSNNTTQTFTWTAGGDVTTNTAQNITAVKTFTVSPKVPTPPAGSTDQTVANTNWISQTGDSAPNNLVHRSGGNEEIGGAKKFVLPIEGVCRKTISSYNAPFISVSATDWLLYFKMNTSNGIFTILGQLYSAIYEGKIVAGGNSSVNRSALISKTSNFDISIISIFNTEDNVFEIWIKSTVTHNVQISLEDFIGYYSPTITFDGVTTSSTEPVEDDTHINKVVIV